MWPKFDEGTDISGHNPDSFFVRSSNGKMVNICAELGMDQPYNTRGIAVADVDGDGRLDYAIADQWGPSYFFKNDSPKAGTFLGLHLLLPVAGDEKSEFKVRDGHPGPDTPGRPAVGAYAALPTVDGKVMCQIDGGSGHAGRSSPQIHFGLGAMPKGQAVEVKLKWIDATASCRIARSMLSRLAYRRFGFTLQQVESEMSMVAASDPTPKIATLAFYPQQRPGFRIYALWHFSTLCSSGTSWDKRIWDSSRHGPIRC